MIKKKRQRPNIELQRLIQSGLDALHDNNVVEASRICAEALKQAPRMPRAHFLAGLIALSSGDRGAAERAFEATVRVNDKHAAAWARLAQLYTTSGRVRMAEASLHNAAHAQRGNPATLDLIGTVFRLAGNLDASREWHQRAVDGDPRHVPFLMNLANAHNYCGDVDAARDVLRRCLAIEPRNAQAHWLLSRAESATSREHVEQMQGLLEESGSESDAAYLHYAIGKELEDLEDWDGAFGSWSTGAAIRRNSISWDEAQDIELFETLEETFTHDWLPAHEGVCFDAGPIFIVGQPRTGTTLLDRMLDAHPVVASGGELRFFGFAVRQAAGIDEPRQFSASLMRRAAETDATAIGEAYVDLAATLRTDSAHIVDKLPSNYLNLPLIFAALPNARVIHMRRDPMDACLAIYKQLFAGAYLYSYDLGELARHYQRYERLMALWRERFGDRFIEVDYEKLAADPEVNLRRILQYIGLSWEPRCLEYFKEASSVMTASAMQVREAPHQRSVGRWKHFERQLQPVAEVLL